MLIIVKPKCHLGPGGGEEVAAVLQSKHDVAALLSSPPRFLAVIKPQSSFNNA